MKGLLKELRDNNIHISLEGENLKLKFDQPAIAENLIARIRSKKEDLITYLKANTSSEIDYKEIPLVPASETGYKLSASQERMWLLSQFEDATLAYNLPNIVTLQFENHDFNKFKQAINQVIKRHEILRTVFKPSPDGEIKQWILAPEEIDFNVNYQDFRKTKEKGKKIQNYIEEENSKAFNLSEGPLFRMSLIQKTENTYVFYYNMHHIISDGWSMNVMGNEVLHFYEAYKAEKEPNLPNLKIQYKDYAVWNESVLNQKEIETHKNYWLHKLSGEIAVLNLPHTKQRPTVKTYQGKKLRTYLDTSSTKKLKKFGKENGGSLFITLLSIWNVLLYRYTNQKDIVLGSPLAGRNHTDLENQIGFYVNTLVFRNEINTSEQFIDFYSRIKASTMEAYTHQIYPFDKLVNEINIKRNPSRSAIFDMMLILQNTGERRVFEDSDIEIEAIEDIGYCYSKFDLEIIFEEYGDYLSFQIEYSTYVYEQKIIERLMQHFKQITTSILENPKNKISQIDYLAPLEKQTLLSDFNNTKAVYSNNKTIVCLFEEQVLKSPSSIALYFEDTSITYKELNNTSNQLANYLQEQYSITPDSIIGILQERSEWMIISILGILKSGAAYLPIDPKYPQSRIDYIKKDSECTIIIDTDELENFKINIEKYSKENQKEVLTPSNLAYTIYTSGSTGNPKGVMIEHHSLVNRLEWMQHSYPLSKDDVILQKTTYTFDVSVWELLWWSIFGAKVSILNPEGEKDVEIMIENIAVNKVTVMHFVPSMLSLFLAYLQNNPSEKEKLNSLQRVFTSGEALSKHHRDNFVELLPNVSLINLYGPTEACIDVSYYNCEEKREDHIIPIGKPISNTELYVLDENKKLVPIGVEGNLFIAGKGLARGYLNRSKLTQEKFIENPFKENTKMYDTGDVAKWLFDGNLDFKGRKDGQVKVRGFRIELGEIAYQLRNKEDINESIVICNEIAEGEKDLVAYIVATEEQNTTDLRSYLAKRLPEYMLPSYYIQLDEFPLTSNGKIDRRLLPNPENANLSTTAEYVSPQNDLEKKFIEILAKELRRKEDEISIYDNFFDLGANSMKLIRILTEVNILFNSNIKPISLFQYPNTKELISNVFYQSTDEEEEEDMEQDLESIMDFMEE